MLGSELSRLRRCQSKDTRPSVHYLPVFTMRYPRVLVDHVHMFLIDDFFREVPSGHVEGQCSLRGQVCYEQSIKV